MSLLLRLLHQVPPLLTGFVQSLLPCTPCSSTLYDFPSSSESFVIGGHSVHLREESGLARDQRLVTIDMLPDDVLLEIFVSYLNFYYPPVFTRQNWWHAFVHVCRRWRYLVFASPRHLNLRLVYEGHRPMSEVLDAWPVLPIVISSLDTQSGPSSPGTSIQQWYNIIAAIESEHHNRICEIYISEMLNWFWERSAAAMQKPFPELTHLHFWVLDVRVPVLPDSFLGGSAPRLQQFTLRGIPCPSLPKLLLSANGLVTLDLWDIPDSGYFSPGAMATALTAMTRLETLNLHFLSPEGRARPRPDSESRPLSPPTRFVLPVLTKLGFTGVSKYLEVVLAQIDAPLLYSLDIVFFGDFDFDVPLAQLHRLICHAEGLETFDRAVVLICYDSIQLGLYPKTRVVDHHRQLRLKVRFERLDSQLSSLAQVCSPFPFIPALEKLEIIEYNILLSSLRKYDAQWLELLDLPVFIAVKHLYLSNVIAPRVCDALQELSEERATEVLPALRNLFVDSSWSSEHIQEALRSFVAARQLSGHPVTVDHSSWRRCYWKKCIPDGRGCLDL